MVNRGIRYRKLLKRLKHRSWLGANRRRSELIHKEVYTPGEMTGTEAAELLQLQRLADLYLNYKCQEQRVGQQRVLRKLERILREKDNGTA